MLLKGQISFAESSRSVTEKELQEARNRGFQLKQVPVAMDAIALVVNPGLNVEGLTLQQVKDIYTGKVTNWQEVGGQDLTITAYSRRMENGRFAGSGRGRKYWGYLFCFCFRGSASM